MRSVTWLTDPQATQFQFKHGNDIYTFDAPSQTDRDEWVRQRGCCGVLTTVRRHWDCSRLPTPTGTVKCMPHEKLGLPLLAMTLLARGSLRPLR